ncbi:MAG: carotenoid biosynthesis protein, partial [Roseiflexaceae bacterium]
MPRLIFHRLALALFLLYLALFPGSTIVVALGQVPAWGAWMGGALLLLQAAIVLCWLVGGYGRHGGLVAALVFLLSWGAEQLGATTGWPFGRYRYTGALQPRLPGAVPLAIPC